jgi:hypothetical protein
LWECAKNETGFLRIGFDEVAPFQCLGAKLHLLARVEERRGAPHYGEELRERATDKAERLARDGLRMLGWTEAELAKWAQRKVVSMCGTDNPLEVLKGAPVEA